MARFPRYAVAGLAAAGLLAAVAVLPDPTRTPLAAAPRSVAPLDRVPADAGLVAHFRAGDLWNHPAVAELKKAYPKELQKALKAVEDETGLKPDQIDTITFHYPKLPMGPGDESQFCLQVTTKTPYAKDSVLAGFRPNGERPVGEIVKLREKMLLHLTSDTQFTVLHESLLDDFKKGKSATTDGVTADALRVARAGTHALVVGFDPSGLPAEIFTAAPPELQPFLPLLKSKSIMLRANLDKELTASVSFAQENEDKAVDAERSFNLLMKLADDGLTTALADEKKNDELKALTPALTELQKAVKNLQAKRQGTVVTADVSLRADPALARPIAALFLQPQMASARARSQNNLKQIGLALHNYHDIYGVLPAAAIVDKKGKPLLSWRVAILPYIEQETLYKQFHLDEPWDSPHNLALAKTRVKVYELPYVEEKPGETHYRVFIGNGAVFDTVQGCKFTQITDGTSNTILAFEGADATPWTKPDDIEFDPKKPMVKHLRFENNSVCNILMCDGSVRAFPSKLSEDILRLLIQKDDGMPIPDID
jgi:prepilin-type processing-associated H-X9-DG protein